jgi:hypothetical protein
MAYTIHEISKIESIMTEEEQYLYESLKRNEYTYNAIMTNMKNSSNEDLSGICYKMSCDVKDRQKELLSIVEQRISLESRLIFSEQNLWCKDGIEYTGIAYEINKNGMIEFYTDKSEAIARNRKMEQGVTAYKIIEGDAMYAIPNSVLEYVKEDKTWKYNIGWGETLVFNIGSNFPFAIVINESGDLVYTYVDTMFEVSQLIKDLYPKPVEILGIQCTILEKSL